MFFETAINRPTVFLVDCSTFSFLLLTLLCFSLILKSFGFCILCCTQTASYTASLLYSKLSFPPLCRSKVPISKLLYRWWPILKNWQLDNVSCFFSFLDYQYEMVPIFWFLFLIGLSLYIVEHRAYWRCVIK